MQHFENTFLGLHRSLIRCASCLYTSAIFEPFTAISLSFPVCDFFLEDLLHNYYGETSIQYECPQCRYMVTASRSLCIWKLPSILVLHHNRFEDSDGLRKNQSYIGFHLEGLDMGRFGENPAPKMNLYGVSNHYGTMHGGHYTAYSKPCDRWYNQDDHKITQISASTVCSSAAYIGLLCYET